MTILLKFRRGLWTFFPFNFEIGSNLVVIVCALYVKLYCFFGKTMTWHLIIGYIRWQKTWLLCHDWTQFTLLNELSSFDL